MKVLLSLIICLYFNYSLCAQTSMANIAGRKTTSLNGKWHVIIDPNDNGEKMGIGTDAKEKGRTDFLEYSFDGSPHLNVPGDFNSQLPELTYFESSVWYKKLFSYHKTGKRLFIHFGAVNYIADVYLNGEKIGTHEGGFTPFQFEITGRLKEQNSLVIRANNQRRKDGIPAEGFDWFNYGGITRDVNLVETPASFIEDYFIQLKKGANNIVRGWIKINGSQVSQLVHILIPEAKLQFSTTTNDSGYAAFEFDAEKRRAYSEMDALRLLTAAKDLGCNFVRLTHYPQSEYIVRLADKMGILLWEEIPVWQGIAFGDPIMQPKMDYLLQEMIQRDKNRSSIIIWSISNETKPGAARDKALTQMAALARSKDDTRLIASAFDHVQYNGNIVNIDDTLSKVLDVIGVNAYMGWYRPWVAAPESYVWKCAFNKPLIMSEFGGEALCGHHGSADTASSWTEEYQERLYKNNVAMFKNIPFLRGTTPWVLYDFRSARRMHATYQKGWNRKGLLSENGEKKKAWYVMKAYYDSIQMSGIQRY
jgi:beta-glucuronidase